MSTFVAAYAGPCGADCGKPIEPGQEATYVDDTPVHVECADTPRPEAVPEVCPVCNTVRPCWCGDGGGWVA